MSLTPTRARPDSVSATAPGWAVLAIDELFLALPQRDICLFEVATDLQAREVNLAEAIGYFQTHRDESWPVYRLDGALQLQRAVSEKRRIYVFFEAQGQTRGLLCDRVWSLAEDADIAAEPMPGCIKGPPSPATGLTQFRDRIAMVTDRAALSSYLAYLQEQEHVGFES
jgi:hypothetical protein